MMVESSWFCNYHLYNVCESVVFEDLRIYCNIYDVLLSPLLLNYRVCLSKNSQGENYVNKKEFIVFISSGIRVRSIWPKADSKILNFQCQLELKNID